MDLKEVGSLKGKWQLMAGLKMVVLSLLLIVGIMLFFWQKKITEVKKIDTGVRFNNLISQQVDGKILTIPYQHTLYKHFGNAINPKIKIPVKTLKGFKETEFLIDSGAVVSALPKTKAASMGIDLTKLPRITIEGFAGQKTFAYRGEFIVLIGQEEVIIPVVFSENPQANNILGRIGFFDKFNIFFDAESKSIVITKKGSL